MTGYRLPAPAGAWIDRGEALKLTFNGDRVSGFKGDTVASAIISAGIRTVGRSYKLHRPRGIFSCGIEEPTGILDIGEGALRTPNTRATDIAASNGMVTRTGNAWPSLKWDLAALNSRFSALLPAGFYYKTFMWPNWHLFEPTIRKIAGLGYAAESPDPERYDELTRNVDVLVIGGGAAGLAAAAEAARGGREVLLIENNQQLGGWLAVQAALYPEQSAQLNALRAEVASTGVQVLANCTAFGIYDHQYVAALESVEKNGIRERLWKIRAKSIILATGAFERPMLFPDNDRPGVMLAGAVERYAALYGAACGKRVVIAAACDSAYETARALTRAGVNVAAIIEHRAAAPLRVSKGIPVHLNSAIVSVKGSSGVRGVSVASHSGGRVQYIDADCIASAGGFSPAVNLYSMAGGKLRWVEAASMFVPDSVLPGISVVGACAGVFSLDLAIEHARGVASGRDLGLVPFQLIGSGLVPADTRPSEAALLAAKAGSAKIFVDLQNDVSSDDVALAARENYQSVEHLKRYTTMGMATDQGKTSNVNALVLMGKSTNRSPSQVGTTKFRPPFKPVTLNALAAGRHGSRLRPLKRMPGHAWHLAYSPDFEEFGGWWRPAAYRKPNESLEEAAQREALHVRTHVGIFEGSPLGKIEVSGPDAGKFLDLMYVGTMSSLAVGQARYGVLTNENGIIFDDGIVARLSEQRFWVNTTSGGVDRVVLGFEEWLQCEFVENRVLIAPITSSWGNVTVSGPKAWKLLEAAGFDPSLAPSSMKHMTMRELPYGGVTMRIMRASFNGELGYEINLPALNTQALLDHLSEVGKKFDARPYGIEALMIMRTEKGFLHVGADTDGTTLPGDVGLDRAVAKKVANFVGRRSLRRPASTDPDRMQLVGLTPVDKRTLLPVGAHITKHAPPAPIDGFVTSACFSPALNYPVSLAMLRRGSQRVGERLTVYHMGTAILADVVKTPFLDPQGERLNGAS